MAAGLRIWNESGGLVFDTEDRVTGDIVETTTGQANGSYTASPAAGQSVEFIYQMPLMWIPHGQASPWPVISVSGNTISWNFNPSVPSGSRYAVPIFVAMY